MQICRNILGSVPIATRVQVPPASQRCIGCAVVPDARPNFVCLSWVVILLVMPGCKNPGMTRMTSAGPRRHRGQTRGIGSFVVSQRAPTQPSVTLRTRRGCEKIVLQLSNLKSGAGAFCGGGATYLYLPCGAVIEGILTGEFGAVSGSGSCDGAINS